MKTSDFDYALPPELIAHQRVKVGTKIELAGDVPANITGEVTGIVDC